MKIELHNSFDELIRFANEQIYELCDNPRLRRPDPLKASLYRDYKAIVEMIKEYQANRPGGKQTGSE